MKTKKATMKDLALKLYKKFKLKLFLKMKFRQLKKHPKDFFKSIWLVIQYPFVKIFTRSVNWFSSKFHKKTVNNIIAETAKKLHIKTERTNITCYTPKVIFSRSKSAILHPIYEPSKHTIHSYRYEQRKAKQRRKQH